MDTLTAIGSLIAVVMSAWALWRSERTRSATLRTAWDYARDFREPFWSAADKAYRIHRGASNVTLPEELKGLIGGAGMPPGLPVGKGSLIRNWAADNVTSLRTDQRNIWSFAEAVYPLRTDAGVGTMDDSIIEPEYRDSFHHARRQLSNFFLRQCQEFGDRKVYKVAHHAINDVVLLAWLELALHRSTMDLGPGKTELFRFGQIFQKKRTR